MFSGFKNTALGTWNSVQCYISAWMEGVWGRVATYICMGESVRSSPETKHNSAVGAALQHNIKSLMFGGEKNAVPGHFLAVQWLELCTLSAKGLSSVLGWGTKIPQAA